MNENADYMSSIKFFDLDVNNAYHLARYNRKTMKQKLFQIRKFFLFHNSYYILCKILIGLLLFALPIYLFKQIINGQNTMTNEASNYVSASFPLIAGIIIFMVFIISLFVMKSLMLCKNRFFFPPWERYSLGSLTTAFFISIGILFFVLNLVNCLQYLDTLRDKLIQDLHSSDIITSTTAKILLYNVFDEKVLNLNLTKNRMIEIDNLRLSNLSLRNFSILTNSSIFENRNNKNNNLYDFDSNRKDFVILDILLKLFRPILFICFVIFLKAIVFSTKNTFYYLSFISLVVIEYLQIKLNEGKEESITNLCEIIPVYLFFLFYLGYIVEKSLKFIRKYSDRKQFTNYKSRHSFHLDENLIPARADTYTKFEKFIVIFFDFLLCVSLILYIYSFSLIISSHRNDSYLQIKNMKKVVEDENQSIKFYGLWASIFFIIGNIYKVGDSIAHLVFYSIEKEFFPAAVKKFYFNINSSKGSIGILGYKNFHSEKIQTLHDELDALIFTKK